MPEQAFYMVGTLKDAAEKARITLELNRIAEEKAKQAEKERLEKETTAKTDVRPEPTN